MKQEWRSRREGQGRGTDPRESLQRSVEHFSEVLNREEPVNPVENGDLVDMEEIQEIDLETWQAQVINVLKRPKIGKAAEVDEADPDLLRTDVEETASGLTRVYNKMWNADK